MYCAVSPAVENMSHRRWPEQKIGSTIATEIRFAWIESVIYHHRDLNDDRNII